MFQVVSFTGKTNLCPLPMSTTDEAAPGHSTVRKYMESVLDVTPLVDRKNAW